MEGEWVSGSRSNWSKNRPGSAASRPNRPHRSHRANRHRSRVATAAVPRSAPVSALAVGIVWAVAQSGGDLETRAPSSTLEESPDSSPAELSVDTTRPRAVDDAAARPTTTTGPPMVVEELGGPMLPTPTGIQLVGLTSQGDLLDIDLDTGQMTTTDIPGGAAGGMATILAGENWTYVQRWDVNVSFVVPRGQPPVDTAPTARTGGRGVPRP